MDDDDESVDYLYLIVFIAVLFVGSSIASLTELRFGIWGRFTEAVIDRVNEDDDENTLTVHYHFEDVDGKRRTEEDTVSPDWNVPRQGSLHIQYLPNSTTSRIRGHSNIWLVYVFLLCLGALAGALIWLCRLANQPIRRSLGHRRKSCR